MNDGNYNMYIVFCMKRLEGEKYGKLGWNDSSRNC